MTEPPRLTIALTTTQISQVLRDALARPGMSAMLSDLGEPGALAETITPLLDDDSYSRSTLRALLVLGAFHPDGREHELTEVARALSLSPSTTHRYVSTWLALGLLEQDPLSRRYRRATLGVRDESNGASPRARRSRAPLGAQPSP